MNAKKLVSDMEVFMKHFGKAVVRSRFVILIVAAILLIPSVIGYLNTRINYDVLTYLPKDIETMRGRISCSMISARVRSR